VLALSGRDGKLPVRGSTATMDWLLRVLGHPTRRVSWMVLTGSALPISSKTIIFLLPTNVISLTLLGSIQLLWIVANPPLEKFNINVVVPMVTLASDMKDVCQYLSQEKEKLTKEDLPFNSKIPVGAMIETPAALMSIDELLKYCDFLSFGTNDLVQYVMAAGREKVDVADYYEAGNQLILPALKTAIQKAKELGKECCICGELAGNLKFTEDLLNIGIRNFSVQPSLIPNVKNKIHNILLKY